MKLQISLDNLDQERALTIAPLIAKHADAIEIGPVLLYKYGAKLINDLIQITPNITIAADLKIVSRGKELAQLAISVGAEWVTVMAGTDKEVIHAVGSAMHDTGRKVMLDLRDAASVGQSALEAKSLGVDAILFHHHYDLDNPVTFIDKWDMIRGNTPLPIYVATRFTRDNVTKITGFNPDGIIVGQAITGAEDPAAEAEFFKTLCQNN